MEVVGFDNVYFQRKIGLLKDDDWENYLNIMRIAMELPFRKNFYTDPVVNFYPVREVLLEVAEDM